MRVLLYPLLWLAGLGLVCTTLVNAMGWLNLPVPAMAQSWVEEGALGVLGIGVFAVWIPTVLLANVGMKGVRGVGGLKWSTLLSGCPVWMRRGAYVLFGYAFLNFFVAIGSERAMTEGDSALVAYRAFSGHWMLFYGIAFATIYSFLHNPALGRERTCVLGHRVGMDDKFCPECGQPLPRDWHEH